MPKKTILSVLLAASVLLNLTAVGGFAYQRHYAALRIDLATVAGDLGLNEDERAKLVALRRAVRADIRTGVSAMTPASRELNRLLAERPADDPEIKAALVRIADERMQMQKQLVVHVTAFRDTLSAQARSRFANLARRPGFVFVLLGLHPAKLEE
ncbi:MAG: periplasmic heavy metal sensor [Gemmataceae bacterium]|nr:periplasmic heavy metal sensor [Gemmataceae bacterium]